MYILTQCAAVRSRLPTLFSLVLLWRFLPARQAQQDMSHDLKIWVRKWSRLLWWKVLYIIAGTAPKKTPTIISENPSRTSRGLEEVTWKFGPPGLHTYLESTSYL